MNKEELKQEAEVCMHNALFWLKLPISKENVEQGGSYILKLLEPREKRIAELEKENAELKKACDETQELLDKQIEATYKLDKENAELKDYRLTTLAKQQTDMSKYALNLEHKLSWYDDQLTNAKEIIKKFLLWENAWHNKTESKYELLKQADQFLNGEVEK